MKRMEKSLTTKMKKNLEILEVEPKLKKDESKYWRFCTNEGWMNVFDSVVADKLKEFIGKRDNMACVEMTEKPGTNFKGEPIVFKNITKCYGEAEELLEAKRQVEELRELIPRDKQPEVVRPGERNVMGGEVQGLPNKTATMYTSYAKDIFCEIYDDNKPVFEQMQEAIELVKQAREAFE